jgi:hypothetical protein
MKKVGQHISNIEKFNQSVLFDDIGTGQFRPTDYDAVLEVDNKYWFAFEVKEGDKKMPWGQSLSYTRTADKWAKCGCVGMVFVVSHNISDSSQPILLKDCLVKRVYMDNLWRDIYVKKTVAELIKWLGNKYDISKLK